MSSKHIIMLLSKDISKIAELKNVFTPRWLEPDFILSSLTCFSFSALCKHLNPFKQRGYSFESVFSSLISLPFLGLDSVHSYTASTMSEHIKAKKDVFYLLKNNSGICWRSILWLFGMKYIKLVGSQREESDSPKCLIFDDSDLNRIPKIQPLQTTFKDYDHIIFVVLILAGGKPILYEDPKEFKAAAINTLPHAEVEIVAGCGHGLNMEKPTEVNQRIITFLNEALESSNP